MGRSLDRPPRTFAQQQQSQAVGGPRAHAAMHVSRPPHDRDDPSRILRREQPASTRRRLKTRPHRNRHGAPKNLGVGCRGGNEIQEERLELSGARCAATANPTTSDATITYSRRILHIFGDRGNLNTREDEAQLSGVDIRAYVKGDILKQLSSTNLSSAGRVGQSGRRDTTCTAGALR